MWGAPSVSRIPLLRLSRPFTRDPNNKQRLPAAASPRLSVSLLAVENKSADGEDWWGWGGAGGEEGLPRTCVLTEERPKEHAEMLEAAFKRSEESLQMQFPVH